MKRIKNVLITNDKELYDKSFIDDFIEIDLNNNYNFEKFPKNARVNFFYYFDVTKGFITSQKLDQLHNLLKEICEKMNDLSSLYLFSRMYYNSSENNFSFYDIEEKIIGNYYINFHILKIPDLLDLENMQGYLNQMILARLNGKEIEMEDREIFFLRKKDLVRNYTKYQCLDLDTYILSSYPKSYRLSQIYSYIKQKLWTQYGAVEFETLRKGENCDNLLVLGNSYLKKDICELISAIQSTNKYPLIHSIKRDCIIKCGEELLHVLKGGSSSFVYLMKNKKGNLFVRKVSNTNGIEGNGIPKLKQEVEFIKSLRDNEIRALYPKIYDVTEESCFSYDMEYLGNSTIQYINEGKDENLIVGQLAYLIDIASKFFYETRCTVSEEDGLEMLNGLAFDRAISRLKHIIYGNFPDNIDIFSPYIIINQKTYENPINILKKLKKDDKSCKNIAPKMVSDCLHGDLTLLNTTIYDEKIRLLDPRGLKNQLDPLYDFGKIKFSLSGFAEIMANDIVFEVKNNSIDIVKRNSSDLLRKLNREFFSILEKNHNFCKIISIEKNWEMRIRLYEAVHYLSDIPFRLYTAKDINGSLLCYLYGTILINDFYEYIGGDEK